jgi:hypothetical protein
MKMSTIRLRVQENLMLGIRTLDGFTNTPTEAEKRAEQQRTGRMAGTNLGRVYNGSPSWRTDLQANANPGQRLEEQYDLSGNAPIADINGANADFWAKRRGESAPQECGWTGDRPRTNDRRAPTNDMAVLIGNINSDNERFWAARRAR